MAKAPKTGVGGGDRVWVEGWEGGLDGWDWVCVGGVLLFDGWDNEGKGWKGEGWEGEDLWEGRVEGRDLCELWDGRVEGREGWNLGGGRVDGGPESVLACC